MIITNVFMLSRHGAFAMSFPPHSCGELTAHHESTENHLGERAQDRLQSICLRFFVFERLSQSIVSSLQES